MSSNDNDLHGKDTGSSESKNESIIREFVAAWSRLNARELANYFTEDGTYYNIPAQPVSGRENVQQFIAGFTSNWTRTDWDLLHICARGNLVFTERLDRTKVGEIAVDLPCCGVFEMEGGKIKIWRDYFDMATFTRPFEQ